MLLILCSHHFTMKFCYRIMQIIHSGKLSRFSWISLQLRKFSSKFFFAIIRCFELLYNHESFPANNNKIMQPWNFSTVNDLHYTVLDSGTDTSFSHLYFLILSLIDKTVCLLVFLVADASFRLLYHYAGVSLFIDII